MCLGGMSWRGGVGVVAFSMLACSTDGSQSLPVTAPPMPGRSSRPSGTATKRPDDASQGRLDGFIGRWRVPVALAEKRRNDQVREWRARAAKTTDPEKRQALVDGADWLAVRPSGIDIIIRAHEIVIHLPIEVVVRDDGSRLVSVWPLSSDPIEVKVNGEDTIDVPALRALVGDSKLTRIEEL